MRHERTAFLKLICSESDKIRKDDIPRFETKLSDYSTANPVHASAIRTAVDELDRHCKLKDPPRPLNCVILGGPGSGKTFLANQMARALGARFLEFNLSQYHRTEELGTCFERVGEELLKAKAESQPVIAFFDEFDVRINGVSAVQYLIQPIYDGVYQSAGKSWDLKSAIFLFSGSYLRDREVFESIIGGGEQVDLVGMLYDTFRAGQGTDAYNERIWQQLMAATSYHPLRQNSSSRRELIDYTRSLEKIVDFVSRINGFVVELRKLNSPLHANKDRFRIELESVGNNEHPMLPTDRVESQLVQLVDGLRNGWGNQRFYGFPDPQQPILQYKNLLLVDRLGHVLTNLKGRFKKDRIRLSRSLLCYLTVVPLIHGMRSLKTVIEALDRTDRGEITMPTQTGVLQRNIAEFHNFPDNERIWELVRRRNPRTFSDRSDATAGEFLLQVQ